MKLTRKPAKQTPEESLLFYATRIALIQGDLSRINDCYMTCENYYEDWLDDNHGSIIHVRERCKDKDISPCNACLHNKLVYAEKRKLSNILSKTMPQLIKYSKIKSDSTCKKLEPSFVDLNIQEKDYD